MPIWRCSPIVVLCSVTLSKWNLAPPWFNNHISVILICVPLPCTRHLIDVTKGSLALATRPCALPLSFTQILTYVANQRHCPFLCRPMTPISLLFIWIIILPDNFHTVGLCAVRPTVPVHILLYLRIECLATSRAACVKTEPFNHGCGSGSAWISINLTCWIRIQGAIMTHKYRKRKEISCFEVLDVLFWGLKASPVAVRPLWRPRDK